MSSPSLTRSSIVVAVPGTHAQSQDDLARCCPDRCARGSSAILKAWARSRPFLTKGGGWSPLTSAECKRTVELFQSVLERDDAAEVLCCCSASAAGRFWQRFR